MRMLACTIVTCGVIAAATPAASETCPYVGQAPELCDPIVRITLDRNQNHTAGPGKCDVVDVDPDPVIAYPGHTVTWVFDNKCGRKVKAKIGKRRPKYPKDTQGEPLTTTADLRPSPYPVPIGGRAEVKVSIHAGAKVRLYKYDITGDNEIATDPEIDVRRGDTFPPPPPPQIARPSPSPSPGANRP